MSELVNLFDMDADDASMSFLQKKSASADGIYRVNPKDAKDKSKGYAATVRFLPNVVVTENGPSIGTSAIEKHVHYAKMPDHSDLQGYYDSLINFGEKCPLTTLYWKLKNSKNQAEVERAELIGRSTKYYSYVLIVEDENRPELEGKIMIFPFGFKIKEKIDNEKNGENADAKKCNIFDPANGKDLRLIVKEIGGFPNYDSSAFRSTSPLKIWDETKKEFKQIPVEWDEDKEKNVITNAKVNKKLFDYLTSMDVSLDDHSPKQWTEEQKVKVERIVGILSGNDIAAAKSSISNTSSATANEEIDSFDDGDESDDTDSFFEDFE